MRFGDEIASYQYRATEGENEPNHWDMLPKYYQILIRRGDYETARKLVDLCKRLLEDF